jgi:hypothetical protein
MTRMQDIADWLEKAKNDNATHVIIVRDKCNEEIYPVFIYKDEQPVKKFIYLQTKPLTEALEVYNLSIDIGDQLNEYRTMNF